MAKILHNEDRVFMVWITLDLEYFLPNPTGIWVRSFGLKLLPMWTQASNIYMTQPVNQRETNQKCWVGSGQIRFVTYINWVSKSEINTKKFKTPVFLNYNYRGLDWVIIRLKFCQLPTQTDQPKPSNGILNAQP